MYRYQGNDDRKNSSLISPGGALQPWDGETLEHECCFVPPTGLWASESAIPGGRHRIALTLNQGLRARVLQMGQAREALIDGSYITVLLNSIVLNVCHMVPDLQPIIPRQLALSIHPMSLVMSSVAVGARSSTNTLNVPPSTDRLYLAMNLASSGTTYQLQDGPATFEPSFNGLQVQYAGQSVPAGGTTICFRATSHGRSPSPFSIINRRQASCIRKGAQWMISRRGPGTRFMDFHSSHLRRISRLRSRCA